MAAKTLRANPSEIESAIWWALVPCSYSRTEPSGRVILIIYKMIYIYDLKNSNDHLQSDLHFNHKNKIL
jgi:hypothetical protein